MEVALKSYKWVDRPDPTQKAGPPEAPCSAKKYQKVSKSIKKCFDFRLQYPPSWSQQ